MKCIYIYFFFTLLFVLIVYSVCNLSFRTRHCKTFIALRTYPFMRKTAELYSVGESGTDVPIIVQCLQIPSGKKARHPSFPGKTSLFPIGRWMYFTENLLSPTTFHLLSWTEFRTKLEACNIQRESVLLSMNCFSMCRTDALQTHTHRDTSLAFLAGPSGIHVGWGIKQRQIRSRKAPNFGWATFGWESCKLCPLCIALDLDV